jgi:dTDP-4-amino-4,6-dideoxygalactose transaminase
MYYVLLAGHIEREAFLARLTAAGIGAVSHYVPLHSSPAGRRLGRSSGTLETTTSLSGRLLRLPLWLGLEHQQHRVIDELVRLLQPHPGTIQRAAPQLSA